MAEKGGGDETEVGPCLLLTGHGGYDKFKVVQRGGAEPSKDEVVIEIYACGLNFADLMARQGLYDGCPKLPGVLGMEGAGIVLQVGSDVSDFKTGDRVGFMTAFGAWLSYVNLPSKACFLIPDEMTFLEAAAIPVNYVTAHQMLFEFGGLRPHKSVLVQMAAGGVGIAATQICKSVENVTVFGTASSAKHKVIEAVGVTHPIDYRNKDFEEEIRKISPEGVDIVLDPLLGDDSKKAYRLLKPFGKLIHFGAANMVSGESRNLWRVAKTWLQIKNYSPLKLMTDNKAVCGYHLGHLSDHVELIQGTLKQLLQLYKSGHIKPRIDSVWHYEQIGDAMEQMHSRRNIGKVILTPKKSVAEDFKPSE